MKKTSFILFAFAFIATIFIGCDKADIKIKKLNHGDGIWTIESVHYQFYNAAGSSIVSDSVITEPGELLIFKNTTLNALFDFYLLVANMKDANGNVSAYRGEIYFDEARVAIQQTNDNDAIPYQGLWSVDKSSRRKQEWSSFALRADGTLYLKTTIFLKKK